MRVRARAVREFLVRGALAASVLAGCAPPDQSALHPAGMHAERIAGLITLFIVVASVVWLTVMGMLAFAVVRGRRRTAPALDDASRRRARMAVLAAVSLTVLILAGLFGSDLYVGRAIAASTEAEPELTITVTGSQWWWEARYEHVEAQMQVSTVNELHVPVGRRVLIKLDTRDVIHSMWVPNLNGKQDLIPGYTNTIWLQVDSAGVYEGQCAEYCGHQHARMRLLVIAQPDAEFAAWLAQQRRPAAAPADSLQRRGLDVFLSSTCAMCHTIRGTPAGGRVGPELTHLGSRRTIAAGTLANTPENLARWIRAPQQVKPGVRMPATPLAAEDLTALVAYLRSLQ